MVIKGVNHEMEHANDDKVIETVENGNLEGVGFPFYILEALSEDKGDLKLALKSVQSSERMGFVQTNRMINPNN